MKTRSAQLDENWNRLQFELDDDGRWSARVVRQVLTVLYAAFNRGIVLTRRYPWRRGALGRESRQ